MREDTKRDLLAHLTTTCPIFIFFFIFNGFYNPVYPLYLITVALIVTVKVRDVRERRRMDALGAALDFTASLDAYQAERMRALAPASEPAQPATYQDVTDEVDERLSPRVIDMVVERDAVRAEYGQVYIGLVNLVPRCKCGEALWICKDFHPEAKCEHCGSTAWTLLDEAGQPVCSCVPGRVRALREERDTIYDAMNQGLNEIGRLREQVAEERAAKRGAESMLEKVERELSALRDVTHITACQSSSNCEELIETLRREKGKLEKQSADLVAANKHLLRVLNAAGPGDGVLLEAIRKACETQGLTLVRRHCADLPHYGDRYLGRYEGRDIVIYNEDQVYSKENGTVACRDCQTGNLIYIHMSRFVLLESLLGMDSTTNFNGTATGRLILQQQSGARLVSESCVVASSSDDEALPKAFLSF